MLTRGNSPPTVDERPFNNLAAAAERRPTLRCSRRISPPARATAAGPALQSRRRCRDRPLSLRTEACVPFSFRTRTAAMSRPFWSAAKAPSAASSARDICRPIPASCVKFGGPFVRLQVRKLEAAQNSVTLAAQRLRALCRLHAGPDLSVHRLQRDPFHRAAHREMDHLGDGAHQRRDVVPLTHEQLATLLGVGRSYTSRVIQAFKAEGVLETRRGSILVRNRTPCAFAPACATRPSKTTSRKCCAESIRPKRDARRPRCLPSIGAIGYWAENRATKSQTTHCFPAIPDYIAPQRVRVCPVLLAGLPFWARRSRHDPENGNRFSERII